ncbi:hypothetical protein ACWIG5_26810 [Streptomyces lydicus]
MTDTRVDTVMLQHAQRYIERHGRHPYTDCWPWAEAALAWSRAHEQHLGWSLRRSGLHDGDIEHVPAAIAETLRLSMARHDRTPGDLDLHGASSELFIWATKGSRYPVAGSAGWPEPTGPHLAAWRAAFSDPERAERLASGAQDVLRGLLFHTAKTPQHCDALDYRLRTYDCSYVALADAAPVIGITGPVEVKDPLSYQTITGLTAVPLPAAA